MNAAPLIDIRGLTVERDGRRILDELELRLSPSERLAITGAIGSGKSTLLIALLGLLPHRVRHFRMLGTDCAQDRDFVALRGPVGLMFQDPDDQLLCPTVVEDVEFGPLNQGATRRQARARAEAALERVGLALLAGRPIHALSGGEKRLAALAGLLAMQPRVLLLDEPTVSLDPDTASRIVDVLEGTRLPMIIATHDLACVSRLVTRVAALRDGRLHPVPVATSERTR